MVRRKRLSWLIVVGAVIGLAQPVAATTIDYTLSTKIDVDNPAPDADGVYTASLTDDGFGSVTLSLSGSPDLATGEFVSLWLFNFNGDFAELNVDSSTCMTCSIDVTVTQDSFKADGDGFYDIEIIFKNETLTDPFTTADTATIVFSSNTEILTVAFFDVDSVMGGGNGVFRTALHAQSIGAGGDSGWFGATGTDLPSVVPIPASAWLFGSALVGLIGISRIKRRKARKTA